jgi:hypothetical protein
MTSALILMGLFVLVVFIVGAALLGRWLLGPVNRAAGHLNAPTRFLLTDFIWLMIQLQVMLGVVLVQIREQVSQRGQFVILALLGLPVVVMWAASVSAVSRAGILQPLRRAVLILVLVPGTLAELMAAPVLLVAAILAVTSQPGDWADRAWSNSLAIRLLTLISAAMLAVLWALALRWLSFWVLDVPPSAASPPDSSVPAANAPPS